MSDNRPARPEADAAKADESAEAVRRRRQEQAEHAASNEAQQSAAQSDSAASDTDTAPSDEAAPRRRVFDPAVQAAEAAEAAKAAKAAETARKGGGPRKTARQVEAAARVARVEQEEHEDFAAMFESTSRSRGAVADPAASLEPGQMVTGRIIQVGADNVFVDLGGKTEAFISREDLVDQSTGELLVSEGDEVSARVVGIERGGQIRLATRAGANVQLEDAYAAGVPVHGRVTGLNKGGFEVEVMGQRGFCPISQIDLAYTEDPQVHLEQSYDFKIIEYAEDGRRLVVSRAELLREQARERAEQIRDKLEVGAILQGEVRTIQDYGAFVDLGGIDGLVHVSEISHGRVDKPDEVLTSGQTVTVKVLSIEHGKKGERIALSIKAAQADPWEKLDEWLSEGARVTGTVTRLAPFGAFVELQPGIEGLVHVSEMSWEKHVRHPREAVSEGDQVEVQVLNIDRDSRRIGLSLKAALGDPWQGVAERYPLGEEVQGTVERIVEFGVFVKVEPGVIALIPMSELGTRPGIPASRDFAVGQEVSARVIAADEERRRLTLSRKDEGEVTSLGRGVQRRRAGAGEEAGAGGGGAARGGGGGGRRRDEERGGGGGARSHREAEGSFATLGDLLRSKTGRSDEE